MSKILIMIIVFSIAILKERRCAHHDNYQAFTVKRNMKTHVSDAMNIFTAIN